MTRTPLDITQAYLRNSSAALMGQSLGAFGQVLRFPQGVLLGDRLMQVNSLEDFGPHFQRACTGGLDLGITIMTRKVTSARWVGENTIMSSHETVMVTGDGLVLPPYEVTNLLHRDAEGWALRFCDFDWADLWSAKGHWSGAYHMKPERRTAVQQFKLQRLHAVMGPF